MACNNDADTKTLSSARSSNDCGQVGTVDGQTRGDRARDAAQHRDAILREAMAGKTPAAADYSLIGFEIESAFASFAVGEMGHAVVHLNEAPGQKGVDVVTIDPVTNSIFVWEVKSSVSTAKAEPQPTMGKTKSGRQLSEKWINERMADIGLDNVTAADVVAMGVKVDLRNGIPIARIVEFDPRSGRPIEKGGTIDMSDYV